MAIAVSATATAAAWAYYAVVNPTVSAAAIAAVASIVNTLLLIRHERHVDRRLTERRNVVVRGTPDDPTTLVLTSEDRRQLEDRRAIAEARKLRERRRGRRRNEGTGGP